MARWRLTASHYLYIKPHRRYGECEWEYSETDRTTGRIIRKRYKVPMEFNIKEEGMANYPGDGYIVANRENPAYPNDIIFEGEPTLDMAPLDEEAERLSAHFAKNHQSPIGADALPGDFSASLLGFFERQLNEARQGNPVQPVSLKGADDAILARLEALEKQNLELQARLAGDSPPEDLEPIADEEPELPLRQPPPKPAARPTRRI